MHDLGNKIMFENKKNHYSKKDYKINHLQVIIAKISKKKGYNPELE